MLKYKSNIENSHLTPSSYMWWTWAARWNGWHEPTTASSTGQCWQYV